MTESPRPTHIAIPIRRADFRTAARRIASRFFLESRNFMNFEGPKCVVSATFGTFRARRGRKRPNKSDN
jgi:hypothetical protein